MQGEQEIDDLLQDTDEVMPFRYSITSYGADYPVDGLVRRVQLGDIAIPSFQRGYVWSLKEASRFIESLLLGLPVPSIFLSREEDSGKLLVIDGQQRLLTLMYFYDGIWPVTKKQFSLKGVVPEFEGLAYKELSERARRQLADFSIHAIIVKQDQPSEDSSSIYLIFERLNTSGVSLTPQEIRTAIYHGTFSYLLNELNKLPAWRAIYGPPNRLMRDQELILRFLALYFAPDKYRRPMKGFLNSFMAEHRNAPREFLLDSQGMFTDTIEFIFQVIGKRAFKLSRVLNAALFDSIMVGTARRLRRGTINDRDQYSLRYDRLIGNQKFREVSERATADEENVSARLIFATDAFADVR